MVRVPAPGIARIAVLFVSVLAVLGAPDGSAAQTPGLGAAGPPARPVDPAPGSLDVLEYRHVGPVGNRVSAVTGVSGDPNVYFFGAASGGIFRSRDGGHGWTPVFDDQPVASIGALAVAPSDPDVIWAGTGEPFIRSNVSHGNGVYRSTDGGDTWTHVGLEESGRIGRIVVHPENPDVAWVAALGHLYGPQEQRGVFRTRDGGATWQRVLFVDPGTGAADLLMQPGNPDVLFAGMWTMLIRTWGRWSGGPNDGLYVSRDGGDTWDRLTGSGLPVGTLGKIGLAASPADPDRIFALMETNANRETEPVGEHEGVLWRSDDGGRTWAMINADHTIVQRPHYYTRAVVAPDDADEVHFLATLHTRSTDGGASVRVEGGGDNHDMWIDPELPDRMIVGNDQGVKISTNRGRSWYSPQLPIAQMYHVTTDTRVPYNLYGNRQDGPSSMGPSRTLYGGPIPIGAWRSVGGCESGWAVPDTVSNDVVWSGCYEGILDRHVISTGHSRTVSVWPDNPEGWHAEPLRYRFQWTFPVHISPWDPSVVYAGSQHVHRTTDGGQSWRVISPDLTSDADSLQQRSGGLTPDDVSPTYAPVLFAIAESPLERGTIWAGSNDGRVHVTRDGGGSWSDVTGNLPDLPPLGTIGNIEPSRHVPGAAWLTVDRHQLGDFEPYVYRTRDHGASWTRVDATLPRSPLSFAHVVREDPVRPGLLYLGTGNALHASWDGGERWHPLQSDLPHAPVHWLTVQPHFQDLVVATYGRGFWIMDDVTPLQQITPEIMASPAHLFEPRPAYRFLRTESPNSQPDDPAAGENPPDGASLSWWLAEEPAGEVALEILDAAGQPVATVEPGPGRAGLNRGWWNQRFTPSRAPTLLTPPEEHAHAWDGELGSRRMPEGGRVSITAPPGRYTVRLTVDGRTLEQPLEVRMDPSSEGSVEGIAAQVAMLDELRDQVNRLSDMVERIEGVRARIADAERAPGDRAGAVMAAGRTLDQELRALESTLFDLRLTGGTAGQDALRWPRRLYAKLVSLAGYVSGSDFGPTDQAREVHALYRARLAEAEAELERIESGSLAAWERALRDAGSGEGLR